MDLEGVLDSVSVARAYANRWYSGHPDVLAHFATADFGAQEGSRVTTAANFRRPDAQRSLEPMAVQGWIGLQDLVDRMSQPTSSCSNAFRILVFKEYKQAVRDLISSGLRSDQSVRRILTRLWHHPFANPLPQIPIDNSLVVVAQRCLDATKHTITVEGMLKPYWRLSTSDFVQRFFEEGKIETLLAPEVPRLEMANQSDPSYANQMVIVSNHTLSKCPSWSEFFAQECKSLIVDDLKVASLYHTFNTEWPLCGTTVFAKLESKIITALLAKFNARFATQVPPPLPIIVVLHPRARK